MERSAPALLFWVALFFPFFIAAETLTIERIFADPQLSGQPPRALKYAPDGSRVTYLKGRAEDQHRYDLWEFHVGDNAHRLLVNADELHGAEERLSEEEKARRERQRIHGSGIMEYQWADNAKALLFPLAGDIFYYDLAGQQARHLTQSEAFETDVKLSPKGHYVTFVREQNLYLISLATGRERALTRDGGGTVKNAMAEYVAQEEMGRMTGYWWSPDERRIAYLQIDEAPVEEVVRSEIYADRIEMVTQRYPKAGTANVSFRLGVLDVDSGRTRWLDLGDLPDGYLPRVKWLDGDHLTYQWQSRDQQTLALRLVDLDTGKSRTLVRERSDSWINLNDDLHFLEQDRGFIWASERSGFKHLYLFDMNGQRRKALTQGEWVVDQLEAVDESEGWVYFSGRRESVLERHLYRVALDGEGEIERLSQRSGMHEFTFAKNASGYIDRFSAPDTPPQVSLHNRAGKRFAWLDRNQVVPGHPLHPYMAQWIMPEFGTLEAPEGHTLHYRLYKPANFNPKARYPALVYLYGGPGVQLVSRGWDKPFNQYLAQQGYVVFSIDNRGSNYRGKAFESAIYQSMGGPELADQRTGARFLADLPFVDGDRIGVFGHSYGGYLTLMAMLRGGDLFAAGVSGAPVTDWGLYDTHYTERYLGHPKQNPGAYGRASVLPYTDGLSKPLLVYHGMADDNVLFTHTTRLIAKLQDERKPFELMTYPGKKHSLRGEDTRVHWHRMMADFFDRHLKP
ncbi:S9 family peptidase [Ferrimonas gelatinilytica]|uniref:S9 family peptidase n=1 Tax=Ferrimonas gelatinilytica TaxID=1255257 RepID=A0ABP9S8D0_9GAMM